MMMSRVLGILVAGAVCAPSGVYATQFTLADGAVTHTEAGGAVVSVGIGGAPADFTAPDDFAGGTLHHRVIVTNVPAGGNPATYKVCFVQGVARACSDNTIAFGAAGTFDATQAMSSLTDYAAIDWTMALDDVEVVAMDATGVPVDASETTWAGSPDFALYYPLELTYQAVVVAAGDPFEGFPGEALAAAPTFSPGAGTYEGTVSVSLASGTAGAEIRYTLDGSDPDASATLYDGTPLAISSTTTVKAVAIAASVDPSPVAEATYTIVDMLTSGLRGRYYNGRNFETLVMTRTDAVIDFSWDGTTPSPEVENPFSVIWTGHVTPRYSDTYTFKTVNDDGVRLWVNDELVIDDWYDHGAEERTGEVTLVADTPVAVWFEYYNGGGPGSVSLAWSSAQQPEELIPETALDPTTPAGSGATVSLLGGAENEAAESETEPVRFQVRRRGDIDAAVTAAVVVGGTATRGDDYQISTDSVTFAAGELTKVIEITIVDDEVSEGEETVELTLQEGDGYALSEPTVASLTLLDNDLDIYTISGTIEYTGPEEAPIIVEAFTEDDPAFQKRTTTIEEPGPFELTYIEPGAYTVVAYLDANGNEHLDDDELWGIHQGADFKPALVTVPPAATGIVINLDVPPGEDPENPTTTEGCCATVSSGADSDPAGWLAVFLIATVLGLRRRSH